MVHLYEMNGYSIAIDINSGGVHVLDKDTYQVLSCYDEQGNLSPEAAKRVQQERGLSDADMQEIVEGLEELKASGQLFSEDFFWPLAEGFKKRVSVLKAMCLHVAHACNMDCQYCFAGKGEYHGKAGLMSLETGKKAMDYLVAHSPGRKNLEVDFFGGEPLLNWDVCKELVAYGRSLEKETGKEFRFTLTTNGLLVDQDVIDFSNKEMENVVLSLDGNKETNDRMRQQKGLHAGEGTYDLVIPKFKEFAAARNQRDYYMRGTYTRNNLHFADDLLHMADLGFKELSMEPVVAPADAPYALHEEDGEILCQEYEKLACAMLQRRCEDRGFHFYHYNIDLEAGPCIAKRIGGCGVGTEYIAVTPEGDIYPCHQFVGEEAFRLGNLDEGIVHPEVAEQFATCHVYAHQECKDCFARLYCSGGCAANAYHTTGKVTGVYELGCVLQRKRIECAIMMKVAEALGDVPVDLDPQVR